MPPTAACAATAQPAPAPENQRLILTCKRRAGGDGADGLHDHDEWEQALDASLWAMADAGGAARLAGRLPLPGPISQVIADAPLALVGGFANRREEFHHRDELLCLDRTDFNGGGSTTSWRSRRRGRRPPRNSGGSGWMDGASPTGRSR